MPSSKDFLFLTKQGLVTPLFHKLVTCNMSLMTKIIVMSYIGTSYAIGSVWILTQLLLIGWFNGYVDSFKIYFSIVIALPGFGDRLLAILRYRTECCSLIGAFFENLTWLPLLTIFIGCLSVHVRQAIACHMLSIDISWSAISKEAENTKFLEEVQQILRKFEFTIVFCFVVTAGLTVLSGAGPVKSVYQGQHC